MGIVKVAVVIPVHNGAATLAATLDNLLQQTLADISITVVENASTDETVRVAQEFCDRDDRVSIDIGTTLLPPLENFSRAMRIGAAKGEYFVLRACDDVSTLDYLEVLAEALDSQPECQMAAGKTKLVAGPKGERFKTPHPNVFNFRDSYESGRVPRNLTFPAEWIYGMFRSETVDRLQARWRELETPWCSASYAVYDFVLQDQVAYVPDTYYIFAEGSGSDKTYGAKGFRAQLKRRLDYCLGCFALRHDLPPVSPVTTVRFFLMCWADSRRKTGYKMLGFL